MATPAPEPRALIGTAIRLDPIRADDGPALFAALDHAEVFAGGYGGGPAGRPTDLDGFRAFQGRYLSDANGNQPFVVRLVGGPDDGRVVGTSTLGEFELAEEKAHLGWTAYDPAVWGTVVNAEAKRLLLGYAFDSGFGRVRIQADERNERSRRAILRLGASFEGLIRRDKLRADGTWRTTALYSVIVEEWPEVRAGLDARIEAATVPVALGG